MTEFDYRAIDRDKETREGSVEASGKAEARRLLKDRGWKVKWIGHAPTLEDFSEDLPPNAPAIVITKGIAGVALVLSLIVSVAFVGLLFYYWQGANLADGPLISADATFRWVDSERLRAEYEFEVNGKLYQGTDTLTQSQALESEKGSPITVKYLQGKPKISCINPPVNTPANVAIRYSHVRLSAGVLFVCVAIMLACCCWEHVYTSIRCYRALGKIPRIQVLRIAHNFAYIAAVETVIIGGGFLMAAQATSISSEHVALHIAVVTGAIMALVLLPRYSPFKKRC